MTGFTEDQDEGWVPIYGEPGTNYVVPGSSYSTRAEADAQPGNGWPRVATAYWTRKPYEPTAEEIEAGADAICWIESGGHFGLPNAIPQFASHCRRLARAALIAAHTIRKEAGNAV